MLTFKKPPAEFFKLALEWIVCLSIKTACMQLTYLIEARNRIVISKNRERFQCTPKQSNKQKDAKKFGSFLILLGSLVHGYIETRCYKNSNLFRKGFLFLFFVFVIQRSGNHTKSLKTVTLVKAPVQGGDCRKSSRFQARSNAMLTIKSAAFRQRERRAYCSCKQKRARTVSSPAAF